MLLLSFYVALFFFAFLFNIESRMDFRCFKFKFRVSIDKYFGYRMQHKDSIQTNRLPFSKLDCEFE